MAMYKQKADRICVIDASAREGHTRIANYIVDLWTPLIGTDALGFFLALKRYSSFGAKKELTVEDFMAFTHKSDKTLQKLRTILSDFGFIKFHVPHENERRDGKTITYVILDPPEEVTKAHIAYAEDKGWTPKRKNWVYEPLCKWSIEDDVNIPELEYAKSGFESYLSDISERTDDKFREVSEEIPRETGNNSDLSSVSSVSSVSFVEDSNFSDNSADPNSEKPDAALGLNENGTSTKKQAIQSPYFLSFPSSPMSERSAAESETQSAPEEEELIKFINSFTGGTITKKPKEILNKKFVTQDSEGKNVEGLSPVERYAADADYAKYVSETLTYYAKKVNEDSGKWHNAQFRKLAYTLSNLRKEPFGFFAWQRTAIAERPAILKQEKRIADASWIIFDD